MKIPPHSMLLVNTVSGHTGATDIVVYIAGELPYVPSDSSNDRLHYKRHDQCPLSQFDHAS